MNKETLNIKFGYVDTDSVINELKNYKDLVHEYEKYTTILTDKYNLLKEENALLLEENDRMNKILYKIDELLYNGVDEF